MFGFLVKCSSCSTQIHAELQKTFKTGKTRPIAFRKEQLYKLGRLLKENEQRFRDALRADLGRPDFESDLYVLLHEHVTSRSSDGSSAGRTSVLPWVR